MFTYPKILRRKDLKKISKYNCSEEIKNAYRKYLTNYSFEEFVEFCEENNNESMDELLFRFTDLQLDKFEPNSPIWLSHVLINFMIYFNVNLDYEMYYDAYATILQMTVLSFAVFMAIEKVSFKEVPFPDYSAGCFNELFDKCPDFEFNLQKDCELAYNSFHEEFDFTADEFYLKIKEYLDNL